MLTDSKGNVWDTKLTYRNIKAIAEWEVVEKITIRDEDGTERTVEKKERLGINVTFLPDLMRMQLVPGEYSEVIAAWLWPQWQPKMTRDEFDDLLDAEFFAAAQAALEDKAKDFFSGPAGQMAIGEYNQSRDAMVESLRPRVQRWLTTILQIDGKSTPESSDSVPSQTA
jgi:hypothetical protein